jgi:septal ring factor EnvC (AmiA/AmiB activator)
MTDDSDQLIAYGVLHEHRFVSNAPVLGLVIARLRSAWYSVAARWGDQAIITQQTVYNQAATQRLAELNRRIVELDQRIILADHDLVNVTRTAAEMSQQITELRRQLAQLQDKAP